MTENIFKQGLDFPIITLNQISILRLFLQCI